MCKETNSATNDTRGKHSLIYQSNKILLIEITGEEPAVDEQLQILAMHVTH